MRLEETGIDENRVHDVLSAIADRRPMPRQNGKTTALMMYMIDLMMERKQKNFAIHYVTSHNPRHSIDMFVHILSMLGIEYVRHSIHQFKLYYPKIHPVDCIGAVVFKREDDHLPKREILVRIQIQNSYYGANAPLQVYDFDKYELYKGINAWFN